MRSLVRALPLLAAFAALLLWSAACRPSDRSDRTGYRTWDDIVASDTLRVGTMTSPTDFYFFRGEAFGLEYQKASRFARAGGLHLEILVTGSRDSLRKWLDTGRIDLSITSFAMTADNSAAYDFAGVVDTLALVLVQHRGKEPLVTSVRRLEGKEVYVSDSSPALLRLEQITEEASLDSLSIIAVDSLGDVDLLKRLAETGDISFVAVDTRLARLFASHYRSLDASLRLSVPIRYSWMLHKGNSTLSEEIDRFFAREEPAPLSSLESDNFFKGLTPSGPLPPHLSRGPISAYDLLFMREADRLGWHWTYLAAIAYTESRFTPDVIGRSGARGLMGIMPRTGRSYGVTPDLLLDPQTAVRVAVDCLRDNEAQFGSISDARQRICFTLAAYNAGAGHVRDAIRLARKYGARDTLWDGGVREYLLLKSTPKYFNDPVVRYGYVRGAETVAYVDNIMTLAALYRAHVESK